MFGIQDEGTKLWREAVKKIYEGKDNAFYDAQDFLKKDAAFDRMKEVFNRDTTYCDSVLCIVEVPYQFPTGYFMQEVQDQVEANIFGAR